MTNSPNFKWYVILGLAAAVLIYFYVNNNTESDVNNATSNAGTTVTDA